MFTVYTILIGIVTFFIAALIFGAWRHIYKRYPLMYHPL